MSRSYKKPYFTQQQGSTIGKFFKRQANKAIRNAPETERPADGKQYRKEFESYFINDYSFHCPNDKKAYRK